MITARVSLTGFDQASVTWHHFCSVTGSVPTIIHYAVWIGSQNPNLEAKRSAMTLTKRRKRFEVAAFLMLAPSIRTQSYSISKHTRLAAQSLLFLHSSPEPLLGGPSVALTPLATTQQSPQLQKAASQKRPPCNLLLLLPTRGPRTTANPSSRD